MLCIEQNDEWLVGRAYLSAESISEVLGLRGTELSGPAGARNDATSIKKEKEVAELQPA